MCRRAALEPFHTRDSSGPKLRPTPELSAWAQLWRVVTSPASPGQAIDLPTRQGTLELAASLDRRDPPSALEALLSTIPANDQFNHRRVELTADAPHAYTVVQLVNDEDCCVGLAAFRDASGVRAEIPETLLRDIGRALAAITNRCSSGAR